MKRILKSPEKAKKDRNIQQPLVDMTIQVDSHGKQEVTTETHSQDDMYILNIPRLEHLTPRLTNHS